MDNIRKEPISPPFLVRTAGIVRNKPYHSTSTQCNDYMVTVFISGKGKFFHSENTVRVYGGMVGFLTQEGHDLLMADESDPYYHYYCRYNGHYAKHLTDLIIKQNKQFFPYDNIEMIANCIRSMGPISRRIFPEEMGSKELKLAELLLELLGEKQNTQTPKMTEQSVYEYLNKNIAEPTDLDVMAAHFMVSKSTLCRFAQSHFKATIQKTHEQIKIDWAKTLLQLRTISIKEVGRRVGYQDPQYFSRVFKKTTSLTPGQWQQSSISI